MDLFNTLLFWAAAVLSVIAVYEPWRAGQPGCKALSAPRKLRLTPRQERAALIVIAVVAVLVRVYRFGAVPGGFNQDGVMAAVDAKALGDYTTDRFGMRLPVHLTAWGFAQMSVLLSYLMVPFIKLLGLTAVAIRLPLLLASLGGLWCLYLFCRDAFDRGAALVVFALGAINPWHILQSRWTLDCNLFPHFLIFGLVLLQRCLTHPRRKLLLAASMVMFGLSMYCYGVSIYTVPVLLLAACIYLLVKRQVTWAEAGLALAVYLLVAWPFIATMAINALGGQTIETPLFTIPFFPNSVRSNDILFFVQDKWTQLRSNITSLVNITLRQSKDLPWNDVEGFGTMYLFSIPFAFAGGAALLREYRGRAGAVLTGLLLLAGVLCGVITANVNINRLNIIYYPILILVGLGVCQVVRYVPVPHLGRGVLAVYCVAFCLFAHTYFTSYAREISFYFYEDFTKAVAAVKDSGAARFYITSDNYYRSAGISEILTQFLHELDAEYLQGKTTPAGELPYAEKYTYCSISQLPIDPGEDAVYVFPQEDAAYFSSDWFDVTSYGGFCTAQPW